jgi:hypothetical protein
LSFAVLVMGCSSIDPGVAGVSCPPGGSTGFRAPSLMTTGGGNTTAKDLDPAFEGIAPTELAFRAMNGDGDHDPCAPKQPAADAGANDGGQEEESP